MPSKLMTIKEALEYKKKYGLEGLSVKGRKIIYTNSTGKKREVFFTNKTLIYYRGRGRWAIYDPLRDAKIKAKKIKDYGIINSPERWGNYGDIKPEPKKHKKKIIKSFKVGRGKGHRKKIIKELPEGGGKESI